MEVLNFISNFKKLLDLDIFMAKFRIKFIFKLANLIFENIDF